MKAVIFSLAALLGIGAYGQAHATCGVGTAMSPTTGRCEIVNPTVNPSSSSSSSAVSSPTTSSAASSGSNSAALGGDSALNDHSRTTMLSLPAPVSAAALPPGFCDKRESSARALGWNFVSKADSEARLDTDNLEACERLLRATRSLTPQQMAYEHCSAADDTPGCVARLMHAFTVGQMASPAMVQSIDLKASPVLAAPPHKARKAKRVVRLGAVEKSQELCEEGWRTVMKSCGKP